MYIDRLTSEPPERGTFRLVISCITTLTICMYSALYLNIHSQGTTKYKRWWTKTWWVLVGIFAPELVLFNAWSQWYTARKLTKGINDLLARDVCM